MSKPPDATILIEELPHDIDNWLIGIDSSFLTLNRAFKGIKNITSGVHLFHYSSPTQSSEDQKNSAQEDIIASSLRYGYWFECKENEIYTVKWEEKDDAIIFNRLTDDSDSLGKTLSTLGEVYPFMIQYPENRDEWRDLTCFIDWEIIEEFLPSDVHIGKVSTVVSSKEENAILLDVLAKKNPGHVYEDTSGGELNYTIIEFKRRGPNASSPESITKSILDKSWYLDEVFGHDLDLLLGELQLAFLNFILLGNFCSNVQWLNLLKLISMSCEYLSRDRGFTISFLRCLSAQLLKIPEEYVVTSPLVDSAIYMSVMENFTRDVFISNTWGSDCCSKLKTSGLIFDLWNRILQTNKKRFGIDFNQYSKAKDEDEFEVYNVNDIDEDDDESPALVL